MKMLSQLIFIIIIKFIDIVTPPMLFNYIKGQINIMMIICATTNSAKDNPFLFDLFDLLRQERLANLHLHLDTAIVVLLALHQWIGIVYGAFRLQVRHLDDGSAQKRVASKESTADGKQTKIRNNSREMFETLPFGEEFHLDRMSLQHTKQ